jgi:hypothetical protein
MEFNSKLPVIMILAASLLLGNIFSVRAEMDPRIVVLPFYAERGRDVKSYYAEQHYRRIMGFINNHLVRLDFEVVNAFAADSNEREYNRMMERTREDSPLAVSEMCKRYGTDAAYIVWLNVDIERTPDGFCKANAIVDGEGYDSAGIDLGIALSKTFKVTRRDCDNAIIEVEKEVGDLVGRTLTAWGKAEKEKVIPGDKSSSSKSAGQTTLEKNIAAGQSMVNLRLDGATDYELSEVFGKVVNTVTGVVEAKRLSSRVVPDNSQTSYVKWRVQVEDTDPFRLEANIIKMINDVLEAKGELVLKGVPYRYTHDEVELLKGFRPGDTTIREVQFVIDRELARDREMSRKFE